MKKNIMMRIASILLVAVIVTSCAVSGTFAKYVSTASGSDTATVAKWDIKVEGTQIAVAGDPATVAFNLFDSLKEANVTDAEENITKTDGSLIAPGTGGSFTLDIVNNSEVDAEYKVTFAQSGATLPVEFALSADADEWKDNIAELSAAEFTGIEKATGTDAITVYWRWAFSVDDNADTALGVAAQTSAPTLTVSATINVQQVD